MAHTATFSDLYPKAGVLTRVAAWISDILRNDSQGPRRLDTARGLKSKTDTELRGLRVNRADIVHRAFQGAYYR